MRKFRSRLTMAQQNGIFLLAGLIIIAIISIAYYNYKYPIKENNLIVVDTLLQQKIDSLKLVKINTQKDYETKIYPFNPNFLKEGKAYRLGMSAEEHDRLLAFRSQGKWINSAEDFKEVTRVSDELLDKLKPYFKFPEWVVEQQQRNTYQSKNQKRLTFEEKKDLNSVTADDLQRVHGIGEVLSMRIIRFREKIGKFRSDIQLKDIYGLKPDIIEKLTEKFTVKTNLDQPKIDINSATLIELTEIPYFDYELAREIFQFIKINEGINEFEELSKLQQFPTYKIDRIKLYLTIND